MLIHIQGQKTGCVEQHPYEKVKSGYPYMWSLDLPVFTDLQLSIHSLWKQFLNSPVV